MNDTIPLAFADSALIVVGALGAFLLALCLISWLLDHVNPELTDRIADRIFGPPSDQ